MKRNRITLPRVSILFALTALLLTAILQTTSPADDEAKTKVHKSGDWPMWGGSPARNMVNSTKGIRTHSNLSKI